MHLLLVRITIQNKKIRMNKISSITKKLEAHLVQENFQGYDPHDALNSPLIKFLSSAHRYLGIAALQFLKRSPINFRPLFGVRKGINPKGYGLLVATYVKKFQQSNDPADLARAEEFASWLIEHPSKGCSGAAWGYNFDWPNRNAMFPEETPTIVNTAYISEALLDLYKLTSKEIYKTTALSSAQFLLKDLNQSGISKNEFCFSYTPLDKTQIHNANILGATLLARLYAVSGDEKLAEAAKKSMKFSLDDQQNNGSWLYGTEERNNWIDSYHTGYNLLAIKRYLVVFPSDDLAKTALKKGFRFYLDNFFTKEGFVKYYYNATYPWDAHAMAHAILTLDELNDLYPEECRILQEKVLSRIIDTFWDERRSCFIYLITKRWRNKIDYIRWVQFWMFYALVNHLNIRKNDHENLD